MTNEGGRKWFHSNRYDCAYNRRCNLGTRKELLSCYKSQKTVFVFVLRWLPPPLPVILNTFKRQELKDTSTKLTFPMPSSKIVLSQGEHCCQIPTGLLGQFSQKIRPLEKKIRPQAGHPRNHQKKCRKKFL